MPAGSSVALPVCLQEVATLQAQVQRAKAAKVEAMQRLKGKLEAEVRTCREFDRLG